MSVEVYLKNSMICFDDEKKVIACLADINFVFDW